MTTIIAIQLTERANNSMKLQEILTKYGCSIRTRLGLHGNHENESYTCSTCGIIILEVLENAETLANELSQYWRIKVINFTCDNQ